MPKWTKRPNLPEVTKSWHSYMVRQTVLDFQQTVLQVLCEQAFVATKRQNELGFVSCFLCVPLACLGPGKISCLVLLLMTFPTNIQFILSRPIIHRSPTCRTTRRCCRRCRRWTTSSRTGWAASSGRSGTASPRRSSTPHSTAAGPTRTCSTSHTPAPPPSVSAVYYVTKCLVQ